VDDVEFAGGLPPAVHEFYVTVGTAAVDIKIEVNGEYPLVRHALLRAACGLVGKLGIRW
jgi:hypothetical protein